uniref:Uncharacterized protein n=1 Tax=Anguilla anguilla TaxID=7936 RepID=A0A0E9Q3L4_ANGAN
MQCDMKMPIDGPKMAKTCSTCDFVIWNLPQKLRLLKQI